MNILLIVLVAFIVYAISRIERQFKIHNALKAIDLQYQIGLSVKDSPEELEKFDRDIKEMLESIFK